MVVDSLARTDFRRLLSAFAATAVLGGLAFWAPTARAAKTFDHQAFDTIARSVVKGRQVDYDLAEKQRPALTAYLKKVANADLKGFSRDEEMAFYTNAYNALVLEQVLAHKRPKSVLDVKGFFDGQKHQVAGEHMTLNELEGKKLRQRGDPRIHFVVNCASDDCPPLAPFAYSGAKYREQLEQQTKAYLLRPGEVRIDAKAKTVIVVELFKWYQDDFGGAKGVASFIEKVVPASKCKLSKQGYKLAFRPYDWDLNAVR